MIIRSGDQEAGTLGADGLFLTESRRHGEGKDGDGGIGLLNKMIHCQQNPLWLGVSVRAKE